MLFRRTQVQMSLLQTSDYRERSIYVVLRIINMHDAQNSFLLKFYKKQNTLLEDEASEMYASCVIAALFYPVLKYVYGCILHSPF